MKAELDDFEDPEARPRDDRAVGPGEKADCCGDRARFVAEIPRSTRVPAHFRLCRFHAALLARSTSRARIFEVNS